MKNLFILFILLIPSLFLIWGLSSSPTPSLISLSTNPNAVKHSHRNIIFFYLKNFRNLDYFDLNEEIKESPLHFILSQCSSQKPKWCSETLSWALNFKPDINKINFSGYSPLHLSVIFCLPKQVDFLIQNKANPQVKTKSTNKKTFNKTAFELVDLTSKCEHKDKIANLFQKAL